MNYYQFNIGDYASHTNHLEPLEDLAFRRLLDFLYLHEKPLPNDLDEIAKLIRMRTHCDCIAYVLKEYFTLTDDGYINNRATSEILTFQEKSAKASASAKARWGKNKNKNKQLPSKNKDDANALRTECEGNAIQETINTKQNTINKKQDKIPYQLIADVYNQFATNTNNPTISTITNKRKAIIKKAWQLDDNNANVKLRSNSTDYFERLFKYAEGSEFLNGNTQRGEGHSSWKPSFEFMLREDTHLKLREGNY
jgi:uncharacterized protein YdaU (DUF1376 family)